MASHAPCAVTIGALTVEWADRPRGIDENPQIEPPRVRTSRLMPSMTVALLDGPPQLISSNRDVFIEFIKETLEGGAKRVVLDFSNTGYIDSSGMGALLTTLRLARENDAELAIFGLADHLLEFMELTRFEQLLTFAYELPDVPRQEWPEHKRFRERVNRLSNDALLLAAYLARPGGTPIDDFQAAQRWTRPRFENALHELVEEDFVEWVNGWGRFLDMRFKETIILNYPLWKSFPPASSPTPSLASSLRSFWSRRETPARKIRGPSASALQVFLCHSSEDKGAVLDLYKRLTRDGFKPWLDTQDLLPGQEWEEEIPAAVRRSHVVIVLMSRASVTKAGYVQKEIRYALDVADEQPEGTLFVIPARLELCDVPNRLRRWHWVDLFASDGYDQLVRSLRERKKRV